jgi:ABC-type sugar transport system ATPase subunit
MLRLENVTFQTGGRIVLDRVFFRFDPAQSPFVVLGVPHAARSLWLDALSGRARSASGQVFHNDRDKRTAPLSLVRIASEGHAPSARLVREVFEAARKQALKASARSRLPAAPGDVGACAEAFGLSARMSTEVRALRPGDRLRLALALAAMGPAEMIALGAPGAAVLTPDRDSLLADFPALMSALSGATRIVLVFAETPEEAEAAGGTLLVLQHGRLVQSGPVADVMARPNTLAVAEMLATPRLNCLDLRSRSGALHLADGSLFAPDVPLALPGSGACRIAFRPRDARLDRMSGDELRFPARLVGEETHAGRRYLRAAFGGGDWLVPLTTGSAAVAAGLIVNLYVERDRLMVFDDTGQSTRDAPEALLFDQPPGAG